MPPRTPPPPFRWATAEGTENGPFVGCSWAAMPRTRPPWGVQEQLLGLPRGHRFPFTLLGQRWIQDETAGQNLNGVSAVFTGCEDMLNGREAGGAPDQITHRIKLRKEKHSMWDLNYGKGLRIEFHTSLADSALPNHCLPAPLSPLSPLSPPRHWP